MEIEIVYEKKKVIQALRYHFLSRKEIKLMMICVNLFAVVAAILFYTHKIRPEPFLLGTIVWLSMMISIWYILPYNIYNKSNTFKDRITAQISVFGLRLNNKAGYVDWNWDKITDYFESPNFFHLYFDTKSFFLLPKDNMTEEMKHELRGFLKR